MKKNQVIALKILVADDEPSVCRAIKLLLVHDGHWVTTVPDGETALRVLGQGPFDLLITDFSMGGMDGVQLAARVKQLWPKLPVIIATASMSGLDRSAGLPPNVDYLLNKPFSLEELRGSIAAVRS